MPWKPSSGGDRGLREVVVEPTHRHRLQDRLGGRPVAPAHEQPPPRRGMQLGDPGQELGPEHLGHPLLGHDQSDGAARLSEHPPATPAHGPTDALAQHVVVAAVARAQLSVEVGQVVLVVVDGEDQGSLVEVAVRGRGPRASDCTGGMLALGGRGRQAEARRGRPAAPGTSAQRVSCMSATPAGRTTTASATGPSGKPQGEAGPQRQEADGGRGQHAVGGTGHEGQWRRDEEARRLPGLGRGLELGPEARQLGPQRGNRPRRLHRRREPGRPRPCRRRTGRARCGRAGASRTDGGR